MSSLKYWPNNILGMWTSYFSQNWSISKLSRKTWIYETSCIPKVEETQMRFAQFPESCPMMKVRVFFLITQISWLTLRLYNRTGHTTTPHQICEGPASSCQGLREAQRWRLLLTRAQQKAQCCQLHSSPAPWGIWACSRLESLAHAVPSATGDFPVPASVSVPA